MREKLLELIQTREPRFVREAIALNCSLEEPIFSDIEIISQLRTGEFRDDVALNIFLLEEFGGAGFEDCLELNLSGAELQELPEAIGTLKKLRKLDLSNSQLSAVPSWISELENLEVLRLNNSDISVLLAAIYDLKELKELDLSHTRITKLPKSLGYLKKLEVLELSNTRLESFPEAIKHLRGLKKLGLSHTRVSSIPEWVEELDQLESLDLRSTQVSSVPEWTREMTNLKELNYGKIEVYSGSFNREESVAERLWEIVMSPIVIFFTIALLPLIFVWETIVGVMEIFKSKDQSLV